MLIMWYSGTSAHNAGNLHHINWDSVHVHVNAGGVASWVPSSDL